MRGMTSENILPEIKAGPLINLFINKRNPEFINWLRANHFDVDGLIASGEAVDKKHFKQ